MRNIFGSTKSENGQTPKLRLNRMDSGLVCIEKPTQTEGNLVPRDFFQGKSPGNKVEKDGSGNKGDFCLIGCLIF